MTTRFQVDVLTPEALSASERSCWAGIRRASPEFASPYFSPLYSLAAQDVVPGARVAVIHERGAVRGFFPFQTRGRALQPLAAPLSDYHGLIAPSAADLDLRQVVRALGAEVFRFTGLRGGPTSAGHRLERRTAMVADVSGGAAAYLERRPTTRRLVKDKLRVRRNFEREHGPLEFRFPDDDPALFDFVIGLKREQLRRTGRHDVFACGWTERFLRRLFETRTEAFGGRFATLRAGGRLVAAEYGLRDGPVYHLWSPCSTAPTRVSARVR